MEEAFEKLKKQGKNDVDNLVLWMKESKIIDHTKAAEEKARSMLQETAKEHHVELAKFKEVLGKLAVQQRKSAEDLAKVLAEKGPVVLEKLKAGVIAFKDAVSK